MERKKVWFVRCWSKFLKSPNLHDNQPSKPMNYFTFASRMSPNIEWEKKVLLSIQKWTKWVDLCYFRTNMRYKNWLSKWTWWGRAYVLLSPTSKFPAVINLIRKSTYHMFTLSGLKFIAQPLRLKAISVLFALFLASLCLKHILVVSIWRFFLLWYEASF